MTNDERIKEAFMVMLGQACAVFTHKYSVSGNNFITTFKGYNSEHLFAYEHALDLAVDLGWIKKEEVLW